MGIEQNGRRGSRHRTSGRRALRLAPLCLVGALLTSVLVGLAHAAAPVAWTTAKAEAIVERDGVVRLSPDERAALESELVASVREYIQLENTAAVQLSIYETLPSRLHNIRYRYSTALKAVRAGLPVATATCTGSGARTQGRRFARFTCAVTSMKLEIPVADIIWEGGLITRVVEHEPRIVGPLTARLSVRVKARSAIAFSQR